jgi:hypothetical protein
MVRWGQLAASPAAERAAANVFASDLYRANVDSSGTVPSPPPPFDRIEFSATNVRAYLEQFEVHTPFTEARAL